MTREEIMNIEEPTKATLAILAMAHATNLDLKTMQDMIVEYMKLHNVDIEEMIFYPNGEPVEDPEMFRDD